eukprot:TRINITY_DN45377_c0_g1_i1.p1 TRINITY_DN45377_c0_g1~~TRINITY_DN45377_c0_g1_i1.p1  ORF type:complete len:299 (-),score=35.44 TRINITY_DN45377_c0_g1_i1:39-935(-)
MPRFEVIGGGSASALRLWLRRGESVKSESDALVTKSDGVHLGATTDNPSFFGSLMSGVARSRLTGESFFLQTLRCDTDEGEALLATSGHGDVAVFRISPEVCEGQHRDVNELPAVTITNSAFICAETSVKITTRVQGIRNSMLSGHGLFLMHCSGSGFLAVACVGGCIRYDLQPGECRQIDNGHLVAWDARMSYHVGIATRSIFGSVASGEGLMCSFTGPGSLWVQTHKPDDKNASSSESCKRHKMRPFTHCCVVGLAVFGMLICFGAAIYTIISHSSDPTKENYRIVSTQRGRASEV